MKHDAHDTKEANNPKDDADCNDQLLAYMAGRGNETNAGDIRSVLAAKSAPVKGK